MSEYMKELKEKTGYISLKEEYLNSMKKLHEKFDNDLNMQKPEDMDQYVIDGEDEEDEQVEAGSSLKEKEFVHPIKQRDMKIDEPTENIVKLEKEVPDLKLDNANKETKIRRSKVLAIKEIQRTINDGVTSEENADFVVEMFVNTLDDTDISTDPKGVISLRSKYISEFSAKENNPVQTERYKSVINRISNILNNKASRDRKRSISQKRNIENPNVTEKDDKKIKTEEDAGLSSTS